MKNIFDEIIRNFALETIIEPYGNGHINDTYVATTDPKFILQRINKEVFKNPEQVMDNILGVTEFLKEKIVKNGGDPKRETLNVMKTIDGKNFYKASDGNFYRIYNFIENSRSYDTPENPEMLMQAARAFGKFQKLLSDYPADKLYETIPNFHNTKIRFGNFVKSVQEDKCSRRSLVEKEIEFILSREADTGVVVDAIDRGEIPLRVTHNDTKLNNVMLDSQTKEGVCVIDLDTVMPGSLLYDFGDALRFGGSTALEDEKDLDKVWFDLDMFDAFTKGFLSEMGDSITDAEKRLLPFSVKLMTLECGMRFLTDYLDGDTYFKIHRENHNLDRARTQLKLVADIEKKMSEMQDIVAKY